MKKSRMAQLEQSIKNFFKKFPKVKGMEAGSLKLNLKKPKKSKPKSKAKPKKMKRKKK